MAYQIANTAYLENLANGNTIHIRRIIGLFLEQTPVDIGLLNTYIEDKDWAGTHKQAHYIKPTLTYVGATGIQQQLLTIEQLAKERKALDTLSNIIADVRVQLEILYQELNDYLKGIDSLLIRKEA